MFRHIYDDDVDVVKTMYDYDVDVVKNMYDYVCGFWEDVILYILCLLCCCDIISVADTFFLFWKISYWCDKVMPQEQNTCGVSLESHMYVQNMWHGRDTP
jgi:hypothetical protein